MWGYAVKTLAGPEPSGSDLKNGMISNLHLLLDTGHRVDPEGKQ